MPTRDDIVRATPSCEKRRILKDGQHGIHYVCAELKFWDRLKGWLCPVCEIGNKDSPFPHDQEVSH